MPIDSWAVWGRAVERLESEMHTDLWNLGGILLYTPAVVLITSHLLSKDTGPRANVGV